MFIIYLGNNYYFSDKYGLFGYTAVRALKSATKFKNKAEAETCRAKFFEVPVQLPEIAMIRSVEWAATSIKPW